MTSFLRTTYHTFPAFTLFLYLRRRRYHANRVLASCRAFLPLAREVSSFTLEKWQGLCSKWKVICLARIKRGHTSPRAYGIKCTGHTKKRKDGTWARSAHLRARKCTFESVSRGGVPRIRSPRWISAALRNCPNGMLRLSLSRASQWYNVTRLSAAVEI